MSPSQYPDPSIETPSSVVEALHAELDAAMAQSAPLAWEWGPETCYRDSGSGTGCEPYHRAWQYLLLLGVTKSLRTDTAFLLDTFRGLARAGARRVQISATADYGMLAHIARAYELENVGPEVTVLDRCETSLRLNRWYAERIGLEISTVCDAAEAYNAPERFDVICAHSFLSWVAPDVRQRLLSKWEQNLRPGGHLITTKRLRPKAADESAWRYGETDAIAFARKVRRVAMAHAERVDVQPDTLEEAALAYARSYARYPIPTIDALCDIIESGQLRVVMLDDGEDTTPSRERPVSGPLRGAGKRVRVVARREVPA